MPQRHPPDWPELEETRSTARDKGQRWGEDLMGEEEAYLAGLEDKLAALGSRESPRKELKKEETRRNEDYAESIASLSDDEEVLEESLEERAIDDPGEPLLGPDDRQRLGVRRDTERSAAPSPASQTGLGVPGTGADASPSPSPTTSPSRNPISRIVSSASRVQFSPRVRISSGRSTGNTRSPSAGPGAGAGPISTPASAEPSSRAVSHAPTHSTASSVSLSSSISASLRTSSPHWLFLTAARGTPTTSTPMVDRSGTASEVDAPDYFSIRTSSRRSGSKSPASSRRLSYNAEEERLAAEAARARAEVITPLEVRRSASRDGGRVGSYMATAEGKPRKTVEGVRLGTRRWLDWRWWMWKVRRAWRALVAWWAGSEEDEEWGERTRLV